MRLWLEVVMSKDRRLVVAIAIALTVGLTGTGGAAPSGPPVRIGGTLALTGPLAATELLHKIAGEIYIDEMNRGNGLLGRPVEWVLLDDQSKAEVTRSLYKRLITVDRVDLLMGTPSRLITWAETTGPATAEFVAALLASKPHPEQGYRACLGVIRLSKTYGAARVDAACARALHLGAPSYRTVQNILASGADRIALPDSAAAPPRLPVHPNIRGRAYYTGEEAVCSLTPPSTN